MFALARFARQVGHLARSEKCRYCCKSPKLPAANFPAVKKSDRRPPIDVASITLPGSPASFSSDNEVPHIFTWKSPVQPKEILIAGKKTFATKSALLRHSKIADRLPLSVEERSRSGHHRNDRV